MKREKRFSDGVTHWTCISQRGYNERKAEQQPKSYPLPIICNMKLQGRLRLHMVGAPVCMGATRAM